MSVLSGNLQRGDSSLKFESLAEKAAFPIIATFAIEKKLTMHYQMKFDGYNNDTDEVYDLYRTDFLLYGENFFLIIEIDGVEFHKNKYYESVRDNYFECQGYTMLHIPAKYPLRHTYKFKELILEAWREYYPSANKPFIKTHLLKYCRWCAWIRVPGQNTPHVRCKGIDCSCDCWRNND